MNNPEAAWIQQAIKGNDEAFTYLVETYQRPVYNLCYRMLGSPQEAEDAAQETFWRAYQNLKKYDPQRSFTTWLLSIAAHYCIDQNRRRKFVGVDLDSMPDDFLPDLAPLPEKAASQSEEQERLHQLLRTLNPQDRAVLVMRYWYDLSEEEIAQALTLTVSAVKSRLHRARLLLAKRWTAGQPQLSYKGGERYGSPAF